MIAREAVVAEARRWIGTPYAHQASLIGVGCDCLGLVRGVWRALHGEEPESAPPYAPSWSLHARGEPLLEAARRRLVERDESGMRAGDVLLFRWRAALPAAHCAILTAPERFLHAHDGACVAEVFFAPFWRRRLAGVFSFPGLSD